MTVTPPERVDARLEELSERAGGLRARRGRGRTDDRWLLVVGGAALPLGLVLIVLGWYGSAQTPMPFEQTPYLISGGILGLALVVAGGLLYFSYWLTRLVREGREERQHTAAHQERLEQALVTLTERLQGLGAPAAQEDAGLVVTVAGTMLHRPDCAATAGQQVRRASADRKGLTLCGLCRPEPPQPTRAGARTRRAPAA
ncbi:MAG: hypothetical protein WCD35_10925 [Mycobacteriales bacterium]